MKVGSKELEASKVRVIVDKDPVATSFEKWAQPGHFSRTLAKGPKNYDVDLESSRRCTRF
jgi:photosystem I P700 chlorophyll a apoprotein A1